MITGKGVSVDKVVYTFREEVGGHVMAGSVLKVVYTLDDFRKMAEKCYPDTKVNSVFINDDFEEEFIGVAASLGEDEETSEYLNVFAVDECKKLGEVVCARYLTTDLPDEAPGSTPVFVVYVDTESKETPAVGTEDINRQ